MTIEVDVTPGAHSFTQALAVCSFRLACGCYVRSGPIGDAGRVIELKVVGCEYACARHGDQVITKANYRLVGWA